MNLLEIYKEKNSNSSWLEKHSATGKGSAGKMFEYTNTNYRTQSSFFTQFEGFLNIENRARENWSRQATHGQEADKHRVVNMIQSKLFRRETNGVCIRTAKGQLYGTFISSNFPKESKWLLNYLFLLNGYYANRKNYITLRVKDDLLGYLLSVESITVESLMRDAKELLRTNSLSTALRSPFFFIHSFYDDSDFLTRYFRSSEEEREELAAYIEGNIRARTSNCCISKKYKLAGSFNHSMLLDESKVFLMTLSFIRSRNASIENMYELFVRNFLTNIASTSEATVIAYLRKNHSIFDPIFEEILEFDAGETETQILGEAPADGPVTIITPENQDVPEDYIDETNEAGKQRIKAVYTLRKRQARIQSGYKCALETTNNCRPVYFTAKATNENYLELHHFIPREFRNDFSYSIEVLANYVTLCPRCHRQIHLAIDRERKHLINSIYDERKDRLRVVGLGRSLSEMHEYYKIDS